MIETKRVRWHAEIEQSCLLFILYIIWVISHLKRGIILISMGKRAWNKEWVTFCCWLRNFYFGAFFAHWFLSAAFILIYKTFFFYMLCFFHPLNCSVCLCFAVSFCKFHMSIFISSFFFKKKGTIYRVISAFHLFKRFYLKYEWEQPTPFIPIHIGTCTQENCEYESNFGNAPTIPLKI